MIYKRVYVDKTLHRDLSVADSRTIYQQRNCIEIFADFIRVFLTTHKKNVQSEKTPLQIDPE